MSGKFTDQTRLQNAPDMDAATMLQPVTNLELAMTNSAFGYEYALKALEAEGDFGLKAEQLKAEIENLKQAYFTARLQFGSLDAGRLTSFENALRAEKSMIFSKPQYLN